MNEQTTFQLQLTYFIASVLTMMGISLNDSIMQILFPSVFIVFVILVLFLAFLKYNFNKTIHLTLNRIVLKISIFIAISFTILFDHVFFEYATLIFGIIIILQYICTFIGLARYVFKL